MTRLLLSLLAFVAIAGSARAAVAQPDWDYYRSREAEQEAAREARREAREAARESRQEAREAAREARQEYWRSGQWDRDGVHLRILKSYTLAEGQVAREPIVVIGGSADVNGHAEGDVVVIGGTLRLGPKAVVDGDVSAVGGSIERAATAQIRGRVDETVVVWPAVDFGWGSVPDGWWRVASLGAMTMRLGLVLFVSLLLTWMAPNWIASIGGRVSDGAAVSLFVGLTSQVLFVPAMIVLCVMLVISIVGVPLLLAIPFLLAFVAILWTAGFAGVVGRIGARLRGQTAGTSTSPTLDLLTGFAAVSAVTVIAHFLALGPWWTAPAWWTLKMAGWLIEWTVWTLALGAALTSMVGRRAETPPAIPVMAPSAL